MARMTKDVRIGPGLGMDRDKDKVYRVVEMDARSAEDWGEEALSILSLSNPDLGPDSVGHGMQGVFNAGVDRIIGGGGVRFREMKPLLDRLMAQVQRVPEPANPNFARPIVDEDIEEWETRVFLKREVLQLHVNFSRLADLWRLLSGGPTNSTNSASTPATSPTTPTSPPPSEPSYHPARRVSRNSRRA